MNAVICHNGRKIEKVLEIGDILTMIFNSRQKEIPKHPEAKWLQPYCVGLTIDIGCGAEKVLPNILGIDKLGVDEIGEFGCMSGKKTIADISADASNLDFIPEGTFDSAVSRHCFEHLPDPEETLYEWLRILRKGGFLSMVLPDDRARNFMEVDPDHKFRCYPETVLEALDHLNLSNRNVKGSVKDIGKTVVPDWSFFAQIRRL